jgi:hypothetical protein
MFWQKLSMKMKCIAFNVIRKANGKACSESTGIFKTKEARMTKSQIKIMLVTFLAIMTVVHFNFIPQGQIVNQVYCVEIKTWLLEPRRRTRPEFGQTIGSSITTMFQLTQCCQAIFGKETYVWRAGMSLHSQDLAPNVFWFLPVRLKGMRRFQRMKDSRKM